MGKPLFKASDGGRVDILGVSEDVTESELRQVSEMRVLILPEVRPSLRRSGFAQAGLSLSDRLTHVRILRFSAMVGFTLNDAGFEPSLNEVWFHCKTKA